MSPARFARFAGLLLLGAGAALAPITHAQGPVKPAKPANEGKPASQEKPETKPAAPALLPGDEFVQRALENLNKLGWIATDIRQEIVVRGLKVVGRGRYVYAAGDRVFYELETTVAGSKGSTRLICDGITVWRFAQVGARKTIQRYEQTPLREFKPADDADENEKEVDKLMREEIMARHGFAGVRAVLDDLRQRMRFTVLEPGVLSGENGKTVSVFVLQGEWTPQTLERLIPKSGDAAMHKTIVEAWEKRGPEFVNVPRTCRLYLGKAGAIDLWPYRVEWLGPTKPQGEDEVLTAVDLRNPDLAATPPADADKTFAVKLTPEEEKLVARVPVKEVLETERKAALARMQQDRERSRLMRTLDPTKLDAPGKPRELLPPTKTVPGK